MIKEFHSILPLFLTNVHAAKYPRNTHITPTLRLKIGFISFPVLGPLSKCESLKGHTCKAA